MPPILEPPHREQDVLWQAGADCLVGRIGGWRPRVVEDWALSRPMRLREPSGGDRLTIPFWLGGEKVPPWAVPVASRIMELAALPRIAPGGSRPMAVDDIVDALSFLTRVMRDDTAAPWIGRLSSGGVQVSWQREDVEVEAVFDRVRGERDVVVVVGENEWEAPVEQAESLFATVVDRLHVEHASAR